MGNSSGSGDKPEPLPSPLPGGMLLTPNQVARAQTGGAHFLGQVHTADSGHPALKRWVPGLLRKFGQSASLLSAEAAADARQRQVPRPT